MAADVGGGDEGKKKAKKGRKPKSNPRIDMTAMVDLGFLLLTFFVLTTSMSTPTVLPITVPADRKDETDVKEKDKMADDRVLTLIPTGKDRVFWYRGKANYDSGFEINVADYSDYPEGLRAAVMKNKKDPAMLAAYPGEPDPLFVLIRMSDDANYKNLVDILDEMNIANQKNYMLLEASKEEIQFINDFENSSTVLKGGSSVTKSMEKIAEMPETPTTN